MRVLLEVVTMEGNEYVLWEREGATFPHGELNEGESPAAAVRRIVQEWSQTQEPKLELVDMLAKPGELTLVFRAMLTSPPQGASRRAKRMELPEKVGALAGAYVEDALKTSLNYKLTRG